VMSSASSPAAAVAACAAASRCGGYRSGSVTPLA
jgi:hypothetical protein